MIDLCKLPKESLSQRRENIIKRLKLFLKLGVFKDKVGFLNKKETTLFGAREINVCVGQIPLDNWQPNVIFLLEMRNGSLMHSKNETE